MASSAFKHQTTNAILSSFHSSLDVPPTNELEGEPIVSDTIAKGGSMGLVKMFIS